MYVDLVKRYVCIDPTKLNAFMEFEHVIRVLPGGIATDRDVPDVWAPELLDGDLDRRPSEPWQLLDGYSGQDGYPGPEMHPSEYIGGRMARDILSTPGLYVAITASYSCDEGGDEAHNASECDECDGGGTTIDGWAVAYIAD